MDERGPASRLSLGKDRLLSPSDVGPLQVAGSFSLGGRVLLVKEEGDDRLVLIADAFATLEARVPRPIALLLAPGHLVAFRIERFPDGLCEIREVLFHQPCALPRAASEFSRFTLDGVGATLGARARLLEALRSYFSLERFVEVNTPSFAHCPGLDENVDSLASLAIGEAEYHLITSPEFHMKRLLAGGMPRIFQFAAAHRAGEEGRNHEPVFTLLEWYRSFATYDAILADTEEILRIAARTLVGRETLTLRRRGSGPVIDVSGPFERLSVRDAFRRFAGISDPRELLLKSREDYFQTLVDKVEPGLAMIPRPVFLIEFPLELGALAQPTEHAPTVVERFELFVGGLELSNGYGELTDARTQRARFAAELERRTSEGAPLYPMPTQLLSALEEGLPPSSGNALGIERLIALCLDLEGIERSIAFPVSRGV